MPTKLNKTLLAITIFSSLAILAPVAKGDIVNNAYVPLTSLPGVTDVNVGANGNVSSYLGNMYTLGIMIATALAVIMIMWGGIEYMSTDSMGGKEGGKEKVTNALFGLILALSSWLILNTINHQLISSNLTLTPVAPQSTPPQVSAGVVGANAIDPWDNWTAADEQNISTAYSHGVDPTNMTADQMKAAGLTPGEIEAVNKSNADQAAQNGSYNPSTPSGANTSPYNGTLGADTIANNPATSNIGWSIAQSAESAVGTLNTSCPATSNGANGCAYGVDQIVYNATGENFNNTIGTADLNQKLSSNPNFELVPGGLSNAAPGDIVISPTTAGTQGHTGIVASDGGIISNSSSNGVVQENYSANSWNNYFGKQKGLQTYVYRAK